MKNDGKNKTSVITLIALAFLLFTRWMLFRLEFNARINLPCFLLECCLFLLLYGLSLFRVPPAVSFLCLAVGCVASGVLYAFTENESDLSFLLPLSYVPVFLFFISQSDPDRSSAVTKIATGVMPFYPVLLGGALLYLAISHQEVLEFSLTWVYCLLVHLLISVVYGWMLRSPIRAQGKNVKRGKDSSVRTVRAAFLFAVVVIPESCLFLLLYRNSVLVHTVPMLWLVNLLLLHEQGHPLVCASFERFCKKRGDFLADSEAKKE